MAAVTPPAPAPVPATAWTLRRVLLVISGVLFIVAAFASGGHVLLTVPAWSWAFGGAAAYALAWTVP